MIGNVIHIDVSSKCSETIICFNKVVKIEEVVSLYRLYDTLFVSTNRLQSQTLTPYTKRVRVFFSKNPKEIFSESIPI